jgi:HD-GYP domain-containing protein (c-di-GMP phosphodiesterase class II)
VLAIVQPDARNLYVDDLERIVAKAVQRQLERWDGEGPAWMAAEEIRLGARIIGVADSVDIWMRPAPDDEPLSGSAVVEQLAAESGAHFDPVVAKLAAELIQGLEEAGEQMACGLGRLRQTHSHRRSREAKLTFVRQVPSPPSQSGPQLP